jgi:hypothetical protein
MEYRPAIMLNIRDFGQKLISENLMPSGSPIAREASLGSGMVIYRSSLTGKEMELRSRPKIIAASEARNSISN